MTPYHACSAGVGSEPEGGTKAIAYVRIHLRAAFPEILWLTDSVCFPTEGPIQRVVGDTDNASLQHTERSHASPTKAMFDRAALFAWWSGGDWRGRQLGEAQVLRV